MEKAFMLTVDGTLSGKYENCACSMLFKTEKEAVEYVNNSFIDDVVDTGIVADDAEDDIIRGAVEDHCAWWSDRSASFKWGDARRDYKIEEVGIPS